MKARPILFSGPMVRALLAGTKTQTRRVMDAQPPHEHAPLIVEAIYPTVLDRHGDEQPGPETFGVTTKDGEWCLRCRYGKPGDLLYVRETWREWGGTEKRIDYKATTDVPRPADGWNPSMHMPRAISRLTLRITDVRVQRLWDINQQDALADGGWEYANCPIHKAPVRSFADLWNSINGHGAWGQNPWVWAISFEVIKQNVDTVLREAA